MEEEEEEKEKVPSEAHYVVSLSKIVHWPVMFYEFFLKMDLRKAGFDFKRPIYRYDNYITGDIEYRQKCKLAEDE